MLTILAAALLALPQAPSPLPNKGSVLVKGRVFQAELALSEVEQMEGLMRRPSLAPNACMFFWYREEGAHTIWMRNCLISLDVAWVDDNGKVVEIQEQAPPCRNRTEMDPCPTYGGKVTAQHFIEFAAGTFRRLGLKVGDRLGWELRMPDGSTQRSGLPMPGGKGGKRK